MNIILNCSNPDCENRDHIKGGEKLKTCSGCGGTKYCSKKCQTVHWKKGHNKMCKNLRERRTAGFKSNTSKLVKKVGEQIPQEVLLNAYLKINDDDRSIQVLIWDNTLGKTCVFEKKWDPPSWENLMAQIQPRLDNMMPCKRVIVTICTGRRGETTLTVCVLCVCRGFGPECPAPLSMRRLGF
jgi:hypothetical protein